MQEILPCHQCITSPISLSTGKAAYPSVAPGVGRYQNQANQNAKSSAEPHQRFFIVFFLLEYIRGLYVLRLKARIHEVCLLITQNGLTAARSAVSPPLT